MPFAVKPSRERGSQLDGMPATGRATLAIASGDEVCGIVLLGAGFDLQLASHVSTAYIHFHFHPTKEPRVEGTATQSLTDVVVYLGALQFSRVHRSPLDRPYP